MSTFLHLAFRWRSKPFTSIRGHPSPRLVNATVVLVTGVALMLFIELLRKAAIVYNLSRTPSRLSFPSANDTDLNALQPPSYTWLREWEAQLPQHNLSLPIPEGRNGRYVLFTNSRAHRVGWNNKLNELLMNTWLAHESNRGYVFHDFAWQDHHYPWPISDTHGQTPRTPLNALMAGPSAGGTWEQGDPAPRAISEHWFDVVCPRHERKIINTRHVKPDIYWEDGKVIFERWKTILSEAPERCIEVVPADREEDAFPETFDIMFWSGDRGLSLWEDFVKSPVSRLLLTSPVVQAAIDSNQHRFIPEHHNTQFPLFRFLNAVSGSLFSSPSSSSSSSFRRASNPFDNVMAIHVRRGDFKQACLDYAAQNLTFYSWNLLPFFSSDAFAPPTSSSHHPSLPASRSDIDNAYLERCLPTAEYIRNKVRKARSDYYAQVLATSSSSSSSSPSASRFISPRPAVPNLDVLFIMSNDNTPWLDDLKAAFAENDGWTTVITSRDLRLNSEQKEVSVAVDMDLGRRAAVFIGNGWSSFTANVVHRRLVDGKLPISIRFW